MCVCVYCMYCRYCRYCMYCRYCKYSMYEQQKQQSCFLPKLIKLVIDNRHVVITQAVKSNNCVGIEVVVVVVLVVVVVVSACLPWLRGQDWYRADGVRLVTVWHMFHLTSHRITSHHATAVQELSLG